jgi:predicted adenine nucleotide alpha hydrolase (AANH) superfamily ATPase
MLFSSTTNASELICFGEEDANKLYVEIQEHRSVCPLIANSQSQLEEKVKLLEQQYAMKEQQYLNAAKEMELKDNQVKKCDDMLKMQIKECEAAKPSFIKQLGTNIFYIGIGIAIGIVAGL